MKIAVTGGTGFLGRHLLAYLVSLGYETTIIQRSDLKGGTDSVSKLIKSSDVIINLAGSPVIKRWNNANKKTILSSRLDTTKLLVESILGLDPADRPSLVVSASAIGIYDSINKHTESSEKFDNNFLAEVCGKWEACLVPLHETETRICVLRIGIVLGREGGMLKQLMPLFKAGLGGKIGSGKQAFSFIHYLDFCRAVTYLLEHPECSGIFNMTAPVTSSNAEFTKILSTSLRRPAFFTVPVFALELLYGKAAVALIEGQAVYPKHLLDCGFRFLYPDINLALQNILES